MAKKKTPPPSKGKGNVQAATPAVIESDQAVPNQTEDSKNDHCLDAMHYARAAANTTEHSVKIPLYDDLIGTPGRRCDIQNMTMEQKSNLRRLRDGLEKNGSKLKDGTIVQRDQSAIKYLLENLKATDGTGK